MFEPEAYNNPALWTITGELPPPHVWPVILNNYIRPLTSLFYSEDIALVPSMGSCYRSPEYELLKGRSGRSLHCFPTGTRGACDITTFDKSPIIHIIDVVIDQLPFRRICVYPNNNFIHVDYGEGAGRSGDRRSLWKCDGPTRQWQLQSYLAEPVI
jgi:hypothetical protein